MRVRGTRINVSDSSSDQKWPKLGPKDDFEKEHFRGMRHVQRELVVRRAAKRPESGTAKSACPLLRNSNCDFSGAYWYANLPLRFPLYFVDLCHLCEFISMRNGGACRNVSQHLLIVMIDQEMPKHERKGAEADQITLNVY